MLTAICANFGDFWRFSADETSGFRIEVSCGDTQRWLFAATENQGVGGSSPPLGTSPANSKRHRVGWPKELVDEILG
jgi:hypothetical protein